MGAVIVYNLDSVECTFKMPLKYSIAEPLFSLVNTDILYSSA